MPSSAEIIEKNFVPSKRPQFENFLFGRGEKLYVFHRLGKIIANRALNFLLHILEFFIISQSFSKGLPFVIAIRIASILILNFWDGFLENKRIALQKLFSKNKLAEVAKDWNSFAANSIIIGSLIGLIFFLSIYFTFHPGIRRLTILIILSAYIPIQFFLKAAHITVFAKRRVYIPVNYIVYANFIIFILVYALNDFFGRNTYSFALIASSIFSCLLLSKYIFRNFADLKLNRHKIKFSLSSRNLPQRFGVLIKNNYMIVSAKMISAIRENFLLIYIFIFFAHYTHLTDLYIFFYLLSPLLSFVNRWPRSFYYDLTSFKIDLFASARLKTIYYLIITGLLLGFASGMVALFVARTVFSPEIFSAIHISLLFLFVVSSIYSLLISNEFSKYNYRVIIILELLAVLSFAYFIFAENLYMLISYYTLPLALFSAVLIAKNLIPHKPVSRKGHYQYNIEIYWLDNLFQHLKMQPMILTELIFANNASRAQIDLVMSAIAEKVPLSEYYFYSRRRCYLYFPAQDKSTKIAAIILDLNGLARFANAPREISGPDDLRSFLYDSPNFLISLNARSANDVESIDQFFRKNFPGADILQPSKYSKNVASKFGRENYLQLYRNYEYMLDPLLKGRFRLAGHEIVTLFKNSQITRIYIVQRALYDKNTIENWCKYVRDVNLVTNSKLF